MRYAIPFHRDRVAELTGMVEAYLAQFHPDVLNGTYDIGDPTQEGMRQILVRLRRAVVAVAIIDDGDLMVVEDDD